jgi:hypothetical protein
VSTVADELQRLYDEHHHLTPRIVLEDARDESSALHSQFEWDDDAAAEQYRLVQAARLIRRIRVRYVAPDGDDERSVRQYLSIQRANAPTPVYEQTEDIASDPLSRAILLREMERDVARMTRRYGHMSEYFDLLRRQEGGAA